MPHYHVFTAAPFGKVDRYTTRKADVFRSRSRAGQWAAEHRPEKARRFVRECDGGDACPFDLPAELRVDGREPIPLPRAKPKRQRSGPLRDARRDADTWVDEAETTAERTRRARIIRAAVRSAIEGES